MGVVVIVVLVAGGGTVGVVVVVLVAGGGTVGMVVVVGGSFGEIVWGFFGVGVRVCAGGFGVFAVCLLGVGIVGGSTGRLVGVVITGLNGLAGDVTRMVRCAALTALRRRLGAAANTAAVGGGGWWRR